MRLIGLTGNLGAGKSTVGRILQARGAMLVDADALAKEAVAPGSPALDEIAAAFGRHLVGPAGLNRQALAELVFPDPALVRVLNAIVHPWVHRLREREFTAAWLTNPEGVLVYMVPLLFETQMQQHLQRVVLVTLPEEIALARLVEHRQMTLTDARARRERQMPEAEKLPLADFVIDNSGSPQQTQAQVEPLWTALAMLPQWPKEALQWN